MTADEVKELNTTFNALKEAHIASLAEMKTVGAVSAETKTKIDKITSDMDGIEAKINTRVDAEEAKRKVEEAKFIKRIDDLEAMLSKRTGATGNADAEAERKARVSEVKRLFCKGLTADALGLKNHLTAEEVKFVQEQKVLQLGNDAQAGYLAPTDYIQEILKNVVQFSPIRALATKRTTSKSSISIPKRVTTAAALWTAELGSRTETQNPTFGLENIATHEMYAMTKISRVELEDAAFDLQAFMLAEYAEQFGVTEGAAFVNGTGIGQPEGLLTNPNIGYTPLGNATQLTGDGLIELFYALKEQYLLNATWVCARSTLKTIRQLKDGTGQYLWAPGIQADARPANILDRPYVTAPDMPAVGANTFPIIFGDFARGTMLVDRLAMEMMVDPFSSKLQGMIEFSARQRVGFQVVITEALQKGKVSVS